MRAGERESGRAWEMVGGVEAGAGYMRGGGAGAGTEAGGRRCRGPGPVAGGAALPLGSRPLPMYWPGRALFLLLSLIRPGAIRLTRPVSIKRLA